MNLAVIWDAWGQYDLALQYGERAIASGTATAQAFETMGRILLHQNEPDQAITWYRPVSGAIANGFGASPTSGTPTC